MIDVVGDGNAAREIEVGMSQPVPETLPVLPLRETVPFPETLTPLAIGQERSIQLVNDVLAGNRMLVMVASRQPELEEPGPEELYDVGVVGVIARMLKVPDGTLRVLVQGGQRVKIDRWRHEQAYLVAEITELPDIVEESPELTALMRNVQQTFSQIVEAVPYLPEELQIAVANVEEPGALSHIISGSLRLPTDDKQALLEEPNVAKRLRRLTEALARELEVISIGSEIQNQVQSDMDRTQREFILRQQLKAIQEELGEFDESAAEANELREQLAAIDLPEDVRKQADRELGRLENLPPAAAEHGVIRTYLEWIASLPWNTSTEDNLDLAHARTDPRRGPLRPRAGQGPHPRVPRRAQARRRQGRLARHDPQLRRPARRRQDVAGQVDRARAGPRLRAHQRRRRARRGRDPRPPAHVHRRDARHDHPRAARRGLQQPAVHDRRDRQDGLGLPRRPGQRDARGARPRAERELPRPLPRPAVRPLARDVHHDGEHARHDPRARCAIAWR